MQVNAAGSLRRVKARRDVGPLLVALAVIAAVDLPVRALGAQMAAGAVANPLFTQAATRYFAIVTTRFAEVVLVLLALFLLFKVGRWGSFAGLGLTRRGAFSLPASVLLPALALAAALVIASLTGILRPQSVRFPGPWPALLALAASTHAAVIEELVFRGILLQVSAAFAGPWAAIALSAAPFVLLHRWAPFDLSTAWWLIVAAAGLGLGLAYFATGRNLWVTVGLHFGFNFGVFLLFGLPGETRGAVLWPGMGSAPALTGAAGRVLLLAAALLAAASVPWLRTRRMPA